ncbi:MAG: CRISPR-associated helicase/endonuclease Cas3, partial [Burkholderiaceae bacterium]
STATQPALSTVKDGFGRTHRRGLDNVREIIPDVEGLYAKLERVDVQLPENANEPTNWPALAAELCRHESVLAIVNTRKDCRALWECMPNDTIHLSALLCGAHRSALVREIKARLGRGEAVRVVSTQLVEAGVDIDFPVVYRAIAGLDSIAQAAGRCNREGRLAKGKVVVFIPPKPAPAGLLRYGEDATKDVWSDHPERPLSRALFERYFNLLFSKAALDKHGISGLLRCGTAGEVQFRTAAQRFRLVDDANTQSVFVLYDDDSRRFIDLLRAKGPERWLMRKLQRHAVTIHRHDFDRLLQQRDIEEIHPGLYAQTNASLYHPSTGLLLAESPAINPNFLAV